METAEARIIIAHNLNTTSLENLAQDLATKWNHNVEYGAYENKNGEHHFVHYGTITIEESPVTITLYDTSKDDNSSHNYVIECGEEAKILYNNILEIVPAWEEDFQNIMDKFQNQDIDNDAYYEVLFTECRQIGADKVVFFMEDYDRNFDAELQGTLEGFIKTIKDKVPYLEIKL